MGHELTQSHETEEVAVGTVKHILGHVDACDSQPMRGLWVEGKLQETGKATSGLVRMILERIEHRRLKRRPSIVA